MSHITQYMEYSISRILNTNLYYSGDFALKLYTNKKFELR